MTLHKIHQKLCCLDIIPVTSRYVLGCFLSVSQQYLPLGGVLLQFLLPSGMLCSDQMYNKILLQSHSSKIYNFFHYLERTKNVAKRLTDPLSAQNLSVFDRSAFFKIRTKLQCKQCQRSQRHAFTILAMFISLTLQFCIKE